MKRKIKKEALKGENLCRACGKFFKYPSFLLNHMSHGNKKRVLDPRYFEPVSDGFRCNLCGDIKSTSHGIAYHLGSSHGLVKDIVANDDSPQPPPAQDLFSYSSP